MVSYDGNEGKYMKKTFDRTQLGPRCVLCDKSAVMSINKPHSQKRTKRLLKPNIQSYYGVPLCSRCLRTMKTMQQKETAPVVAQ